MAPPLPSPRYLGDGVYGLFDGHQIWLGLAAGQRQIALEPTVLIALNEYWRDIRHYYREQPEVSADNEHSTPIQD